MATGTKIKDLEAQTTLGRQAYQRLPGSGPVMLIALPAPAKDYLCLSITAFCFCILLAIPALLFSLKVGTIFIFVSHGGTPLPFLRPSTPGSRLAPLSHPVSLLVTSSPPSSPDIRFSRHAPPLPPSSREPSCLLAFSSADPGSQLCWGLEARPEELHAGLGFQPRQHPRGVHCDGQLYYISL